MGARRHHHYNFAHVALRELGFANGPVAVSQALATPMGLAFLKALWNSVGELCSPSDRLDPTGLSCTARKLSDGSTAIVVGLPPAERSPEAWFVAYVIAPARAGAASSLRFFTLEESSDFETGGRATVFAEWIAHPQPNHQNMGYGPAPDVEAFIKAIEGVHQRAVIASISP